MPSRIPLIVGIDPGTTMAVAGLDLDGNLVFITSMKNLSRPRLFELIFRHGEPVVIASDKTPLPRFFGRFAAGLDARLFFPRQVMTRKEKFLEAREFRRARGRAWNNMHERDALVAGLTAWKAVRPTIAKIDRRLARAGLTDERSRVARDVLARRESIDKSLKRLG
jgi:predicted RNase H-like nuclease (RuvC/YqgF family)